MLNLLTWGDPFLMGLLHQSCVWGLSVSFREPEVLHASGDWGGRTLSVFFFMKITLLTPGPALWLAPSFLPLSSCKFVPAVAQTWRASSTWLKPIDCPQKAANPSLANLAFRLSNSLISHLSKSSPFKNHFHVNCSTLSLQGLWEVTF